MGISVEALHDAFTANGTVDGLIAIADTSDYLVGMIGYVRSTSVAPARVKVTEVVDTTHIRVADAPASSPGGGSYPRWKNLTAFTTLDNATIDIEPQVVPGRSPN